MSLIRKLKAVVSLVLLAGFALAIGGCGAEGTKPGAGTGAAAPNASKTGLKVSPGPSAQAGSEEDMGAEEAAPGEAEEGAGE